MNKNKLIQSIICELEKLLEEACEAASNARQDATNSESVAETQYDTLGLEASYLAHGQSMRIEELKQQLSCYRQLAIKDYGEDDPIGLGALVQLASQQNTDKEAKDQWFFIGPTAGGLMLRYEGSHITVISNHSPVGKSLVGHYQDDDIERMLDGQLTQDKIIKTQ